MSEFSCTLTLPISLGDARLYLPASKDGAIFDGSISLETHVLVLIPSSEEAISVLLDFSDKGTCDRLESLSEGAVLDLSCTLQVFSKSSPRRNLF